MAQVTNPSHDGLEVPSLGLVFEPGETIDVDDVDAASLGWPFIVNGRPAHEAQQAAGQPEAAPAAPAEQPAPVTPVSEQPAAPAEGSAQ